MTEGDPRSAYPLGARRPDLVRTPSGLGLSDVTLEALRAGRLSSTDMRATPETLRLQADVARAAGRAQLAACIERAAELTGIPDDEILEIYTALRPGRSSPEELERWAERLEHEHAAPMVAAFVREARERLRVARAVRAPDAVTESRRAEARLARDVRRETLVGAEPELGLVAMASPNDPDPSLVVENGRVVEMDGRPAADFDVIDRFIAQHGLDLEIAAEAMRLSDAELARSLVDVDVPRQDLVRLSRGLTPARLARVAAVLEPVEMMFALRRAPRPRGGRPTRRT